MSRRGLEFRGHAEIFSVCRAAHFSWARNALNCLFLKWWAVQGLNL
nr:A17 [uncultured bacterium]